MKSCRVARPGPNQELAGIYARSFDEKREREKEKKEKERRDEEVQWFFNKGSRQTPLKSEKRRRVTTEDG
ncbi:hypothetical protein ANTQUA_LOCUS7871 [Anthophora quadrimaculata]